MRKPPTAAQKAAAAEKRAALIARSQPIQAARKGGLLPWAALPTVNACLELIYSSETGQSSWKTFFGWKEAGFPVCKGEKGFAIWGRPLDVKKDAENAAGEVGEENFSFFPVSYLFHAGQVADADGNRPPEYKSPNPFLEFIKSQPLALPAPADVQPIAA